MTEHPTAGSYVKIVPIRDGSFAVATYDRNGICYSLKGRHFTSSYGEALLYAQLFQARGYELRDEAKEARR